MQIIEVPSHSNPSKVYRVDLAGQRCSCPAWIYQKGGRKPCKHLRVLLGGGVIVGARVVELDMSGPAPTKFWPPAAPQLDIL